LNEASFGDLTPSEIRKEVTDIKSRRKWKYLVVIRGKGTPKEQRIRTRVKVCWSEAIKRWLSIPDSE
jgi:hypothetical protein